MICPLYKKAFQDPEDIFLEINQEQQKNQKEKINV